MKKGKIIPNGVMLEAHEYATVVFLTELGYDVELTPKSEKHGVHSPDIQFLGLPWEMKSPRGEGSSLMKNTLQKAAKQSENVIMDLRRTKRHQIKCMREIEREFTHNKSLQRLKVITKSQKVVDFTK